jgi:hypothetical protein
MQEKDLRAINKRAIGETVSWAATTIIIFFIVGIALIGYRTIGKTAFDTSGEKIQDSSWKNLENLRNTESFLFNDLSSGNKGEALSYIYNEKYSDVKKLFENFGKTNGIVNLKIAMDVRDGKVYTLCSTESGNPINFLSTHNFPSGLFTYSVFYVQSKKASKFIQVLVSEVKCNA